MDLLFSQIPIWECIISFIFLSSLILLSLVYTRLNWVLKSLITLSAIVVFILAYTSISNSYGWAYSGSMPEYFQITWIQVDEPTDGTEGAIYYWVREYSSANKTLSQPRAYITEYTKDDHKTASKMKKQLQDGKKIYAKRKYGLSESLSQLEDEMSGRMNPNTDSGKGKALGGEESENESTSQFIQLMPPDNGGPPPKVLTPTSP